MPRNGRKRSMLLYDCAISLLVCNRLFIHILFDISRIQNNLDCLFFKLIFQGYLRKPTLTTLFGIDGFLIELDK